MALEHDRAHAGFLRMQGGHVEVEPARQQRIGREMQVHVDRTCQQIVDLREGHKARFGHGQPFSPLSWVAHDLSRKPAPAQGSVGGLGSVVG
jgi:hypothetical protein